VQAGFKPCNLLAQELSALFVAHLKEMHDGHLFRALFVSLFSLQIRLLMDVDCMKDVAVFFG
jgi:hypothetical protein